MIKSIHVPTFVMKFVALFITFVTLSLCHTSLNLPNDIWLAECVYSWSARPSRHSSFYKTSKNDNQSYLGNPNSIFDKKKKSNATCMFILKECGSDHNVFSRLIDLGQNQMDIRSSRANSSHCIYSD